MPSPGRYVFLDVLWPPNHDVILSSFVDTSMYTPRDQQEGIGSALTCGGRAVVPGLCEPFNYNLTTSCTSVVLDTGAVQDPRVGLAAW